MFVLLSQSVTFPCWWNPDRKSAPCWEAPVDAGVTKMLSMLLFYDEWIRRVPHMTSYHSGNTAWLSSSVHPLCWRQVASLPSPVHGWTVALNQHPSLIFMALQEPANVSWANKWWVVTKRGREVAEIPERVGQVAELNSLKVKRPWVIAQVFVSLVSSEQRQPGRWIRTI